MLNYSRIPMEQHITFALIPDEFSARHAVWPVEGSDGGAGFGQMSCL